MIDRAGFMKSRAWPGVEQEYYSLFCLLGVDNTKAASGQTWTQILRAPDQGAIRSRSK